MNALTIDVGGTRVKFLAVGQEEKREIPSGKYLTPRDMVAGVRGRTADWDYEAVSIGYPGLVGRDGPAAETESLGAGWVGFDFAAAFGRPVQVLNDAAMQALGSYQGGRMLFLGLGTGLGSTFISGKTIVPLELGRLPFRGGRLDGCLGRDGLARLGEAEWRRALAEAVFSLKEAFMADYVVLGGGNAERVGPLPEGSRLGNNDNAFEGGFRLWEEDVAPVEHVTPATVWKLVL